MARAEPGAHARVGLTAADWAHTRRIEVDGVPVSYREAGAGPVIVLVHGLGMLSDYWARTAPALAASGYRVLAPDLPGFGRTPGPPDGLTLREQVSALARWAAALELPPAVYVGHSLSCQTVLELAVRSPATVTGLVLGAPTGRGGGLRMVGEAARLFVDAWRESLQLLAVAAHGYLRAGPVRFWKSWKRGEEHDPLPLLRRVEVPVLVVVGERDPVVPLESAREMAGAAKRGRLAVIPGAAHALSYHRPERFVLAVVSLLRVAHG